MAFSIFGKTFGKAAPVQAAPPPLPPIAESVKAFKGKSLADLADPAWETISGLPPFQYAGALWRPYSVLDSEKAYRANSVVHSCCRLIANSLCEPRLQLTATVGRKETEIENHPLLDLLENPNPFYSRNETLMLFALRRMLTGTGYLWKWRTKNKSRIAQLWPLPSSWVRTRAGHGDQLITQYEITQLGGQRQTVDATEMVRTGMVDPSTMLETVSPLAAAQHEYQLDMERQDYVVEMLTNMHVPGLTYKPKFRLQGQSREELRDSLENRVGIGKRGNVMILDPGDEAEIMEPLKDFDWPAMDDLIESRICSAFGVPPILVGLRVGLEHSTYSNYGTARQSFYTETLRPLWTALGDALTLSLCRNEGEQRLKISFDLSDVTELQEDLDKRAARAQLLYAARLITKNEARDLVDMEPAADGTGEEYDVRPEPATPFGASAGAGMPAGMGGGE